MPMHLDHYQLSTRNIYVSAQKLREETGLSFYDGGFFPDAGIANKIFPLGEGTYIEVEGVVDAGAIAMKPDGTPVSPGARGFYDRTADGECFSLLSMRVDTLDELKEIADRHKSVISQSAVVRVRPNGPPVQAYSTPAGAGKQGRVNWYCHENRINMHPSGQPVFPWPKVVEPKGIAWLEVGGTEKDMTDWLGVPASNFPYRYNGKAHGLYAIAVKSDKGEIVIRRPWRV